MKWDKAHMQTESGFFDLDILVGSLAMCSLQTPFLAVCRNLITSFCKMRVCVCVGDAGVQKDVDVILTEFSKSYYDG